MLTDKFNLYRHGWLELVFEGRNKMYGAYELRQHNDRRMAKSLGFGFLLFAAFFIVAYFNANKEEPAKPDEILKLTDVNLNKVIIPEQQKVEPPKPVKKQKPAPKLETRKFVAPKLVPDVMAEEPPTLKELDNVQIGTENITGKKGTETSPVTASNGTGEANTPVVDDGIHTIGTIEKMPEFAGGFAAWAKFLQKNLRYPSYAVDNSVTGKVFVSFVVERDGSLSNIKVLKGIGFGCDEEAVRVLKKAPAWAPGIHNGQPVRVQYTMPISFQLN